MNKKQELVNIVPRIYASLAAYEDIGLDPEEDKHEKTD